MKILVIGSGGREHALTWKLRESQLMDEIYCAPGNAGIAQEAECISVDLSSPAEIVEVAAHLKADLTVIGPEAPLVGGVVDLLHKAGLPVVGPNHAAAALEGSKVFSKTFMRKHGIPTAPFVTADTFEGAVQALAGFPSPWVIKADGLAAGKGVTVAKTHEEAERCLDALMRQGSLGRAGERVVIEECLRGEELSMIVLTDGRTLLPMALSQDHKALYDNDEGPNTGGMGAYSDDSILSAAYQEQIQRTVVEPTLAGLRSDGLNYRGFLYIGLMLTADGPRVLEYNVRLGDPEAQPIMMRLRTDLAGLLQAVCEERLAAVDLHWTPNPAVCVVLASKGYPGAPEMGKPISGYDVAETLGGVKVFHAGTRVEDHQLLTNGGRVLGVTATAEDLPSAIQLCYAGVSKIAFEGMQFRKDIGAKALAGSKARVPALGGPGTSSRMPSPHT